MVAPQQPAWGTFQKPPSRDEQMQQAESNEMSQEIPGDIKDQESPQGEKPQWGNFETPTTYQGEPDPTADESNLSYFVRNATANASRVIEKVAGRYGDMQKFATDAVANVPETGGVIGWALSEMMGKEGWERLVRGDKNQQQNLPTSQNLKDMSQSVTGGYTKPKTKGEGAFQEYVEDVASTLNRGNLSGMTLQQGINQVLIPSAANVVKQTVDHLGFGEDKANMAKMAVWLPMSLARMVNGSQFASNLMNQGRQGMPATVQSNVPRLMQNLDNLSRSPNMLSSDPRTALARQQIEAIRRDLANGQTSVRSLQNGYDGINAAKRNRDMFSMSRGDQNFARRSIDQVRDVIRDEIMQSGSAHPQALRDWSGGVNAWATIHRSNAITNYISELAQGKYAKILTGPAAALFGIGTYAAKQAPLLAGPAVAATAATAKTAQTLYRMYNNPHLARYYWDAIGDVIDQNTPAFISNYNKLNKELEKPTSNSVKVKAKAKE